MFYSRYQVSIHHLLFNLLKEGAFVIQMAASLLASKIHHQAFRQVKQVENLQVLLAHLLVFLLVTVV